MNTKKAVAAIMAVSLLTSTNVNAVGEIDVNLSDTDISLSDGDNIVSFDTSDESK